MAGTENQMPGDRTHEAIKLLAFDSERQWRILTHDERGFFLATTVDPIFMPLENPCSEWKNSELRKKLNTVFLDCLSPSLAQWLCPISYSDGQSTTLDDKVILLDSNEADHIKSYKPKNMDQREWDNVLFDWTEIPCIEGLTFRLTGMNLEAKISILKWARECFQSDGWRDWILLRDDERMTCYGGGDSYFIPNGVHPVICLDARPADGLFHQFRKARSIASFWGEAEEEPPEEAQQPGAPTVDSYSCIYDDDIPF